MYMITMQMEAHAQVQESWRFIIEKGPEALNVKETEWVILEEELVFLEENGALEWEADSWKGISLVILLEGF